MKVLLFSMYYSGLLLRVLAGYENTNPLSLNWRWRHWKRRYLYRSDWY